MVVGEGAKVKRMKVENGEKWWSKQATQNFRREELLGARAPGRRHSTFNLVWAAGSAMQLGI